MKVKVLVLVVLTALLIASLAGGFVLLWRLLVLSLVVLSLGYGWAAVASRSLKVHAATLPERCEVGQRLERYVTVTNNGVLPEVLVKVRLDADETARQEPVSLALGSRGSARLASAVWFGRRGRYLVGKLRATVTDPFGLFSISQGYGESSPVLVCPAAVDLPLFSPLSEDDFGDGAKRWLGSGTSSNAARIREYASGDSFNRIHWRSTAHTGQIMVKVFDTDRAVVNSRNIWVVADMHAASHLGSGDQSTEEYCVTVSASLAKKFLNSGGRVGLIADGDQRLFLPPDSGDQQLWRLLEALALIRATGETTVSALISKESKRFGANPVVMVVTPSVEPQVAVTLRNLAARGIMVVAVMTDPASFGGPSAASVAARRLLLGGIHSYVVKQGEDLGVVLDSRLSHSIGSNLFEVGQGV